MLVLATALVFDRLPLALCRACDVGKYALDDEAQVATAL